MLNVPTRIRALTHAACLGLIMFGTVLNARPAQSQTGPCESYQITGYTSTDYPGLTADGTPTPGNEWAITAASYNLPLGSYVWVDGVGTLRVADRGQLGARHLDILVSTRAEAYALTGWRTACPL